MPDGPNIINSINKNKLLQQQNCYSVPINVVLSVFEIIDNKEYY